MSLSLSLPPPRNNSHTSTIASRTTSTTEVETVQQQSSSRNDTTKKSATQNKAAGRRPVPSYEERCRAAIKASKVAKAGGGGPKPKLFVPRCLEDFGDGGAFPEIHVAQYPRHMGNPHVHRRSNTAGNDKKQPSTSGIVSKSRALINVEIDEKGDVSYDAIVTSGTNSNKKVYTKLDDVKPSLVVREEDASNPTEEEEDEVSRKTQAALDALIANQTALDKPSGTAIENVKAGQNVDGSRTQFIKYIPKKDAPGYNPTAAQRVIQMVPAQIDPMMPPKHKHIKAPRGPAEDPVPVLHAPVTTKLTKEERDSWNIPACISNWKNTRGYTIPLDKRLAADGRALRDDTSINSNFATLSESLYVAEQQARQEVKMRAQVQKKLVMAEKEQREQQLRDLANQARIQRTNPSQQAEDDDDDDVPPPPPPDDDDDDDVPPPPPPDDDDIDAPPRDDDRKPQRIETDEEVAAKQRDKLRMERKRERDRELRREHNSEYQKQKQQKLEAASAKLEDDRDVSEKIALGTFTGSGGGGAGEVDARLYNQSSGMDSGFGADDEYNTYTKPLFGSAGGAGVSSSSIYRPTRGETEFNADDQYAALKQGTTSKFQPDKGFSGAEGGAQHVGGGQSRTAPVQFEKERKR